MSTHSNPYQYGLDKNSANFAAMSPLSFIERSAWVYPDHPAVVHQQTRRTWLQTYNRCRQLASALSQKGIGEGDTVAVMAPNLPELFEAHFGVPMCGAVLNALNVRLDAEAIAFILQHGEAKVVIVDREFSDVITKALKMIPHKPLVIDIDDPYYEGGSLIGNCDYEAFIGRSEERRVGKRCRSRWAPYQ